MSRHNLAMALTMAALAGTLIDENQPAKTLTPEEKEKWLREREEAEDRRRRDAQKAQADWKAQQDAIAAPFREARRLRQLKKLQQGQTS